MGYQIDYQPVKKVRGMEKRTSRRAALTAICLSAFFLITNYVWPAGADLLRDWILPGDAAVTAAALEDLAFELEMGQSLGDAAANFCRRVIQNAQAYPY